MREPGTAVVGAQGYLGATLVRTLDASSPVVGLVRRPRRPNETQYDFWQDDLGSRLADVKTGAVVFAARVHPVADARRMAEFAERVATAARTCGDRQLVLVSTDAVFRGDRGDYHEDDPPAPATAYGRCARVLEEQVMACAANWCIVRPSYIFGFAPDGLDKRLFAAARAADAGEPFDVHPDLVRSPIEVTELARAIRDIVERRVGGIVHAGGPAVDVATFFQDGLRALGYSTHTLRRVPARPGTPRNTSLHVRRLLQTTSVVPRGIADALVDHRQTGERSAS